MIKKWVKNPEKRKVKTQEKIHGTQVQHLTLDHRDSLLSEADIRYSLAAKGGVAACVGLCVNAIILLYDWFYFFVHLSLALLNCLAPCSFWGFYPATHLIPRPWSFSYWVKISDWESCFHTCFIHTNDHVLDAVNSTPNFTPEYSVSGCWVVWRISVVSFSKQRIINPKRQHMSWLR